MPYYTITDFAAGLDLRRSALTAPEGTLRVLRNCHVTPGGEIEKRYAFAKIKTVPAATKGLVDVNNNLYVFGPDSFTTTDPSNPWDVGILRLATPELIDIIDYDLFINKVFAIAQTDTAGTVQRFYNGAVVAGANGYFCRTYKSKMFAVANDFMYYSAVNNPADWAGVGSGNIQLSTGDSAMDDCLGLEVYYDKLAIFSKNACQLWIIDPDPDLTQYVQTLRQAGTVAHQSVLQYGSGDVLYVAPDGIRSLRARNSSLAASVSDIGSPLDPLMQGLFRDQGENFMANAISILQPVTGRFWVILPDRIYVLSAFPGPKINAWSEYVPTDQAGNPFTITAAVQHRQHVVVRDDANNIYSYGGGSDTGVTYDSSPVEIVFPFHSGNQPATHKNFKGIDAACEGQWKVYAAFDPSNEEAEDYLGQLDGPTFLQGRFPAVGHSTHLSLRLRSEVEGPLTLSNMIVHYELAEQG